VQAPPPAPVTVGLTPASATVVLGATQQFTATVSGSSNSAVGWSVNGVPGGNTSVGTVSSTGLFTAPQNLPTPASVTITATSQADATKSAAAAAGIQSDLVVTISPDPASIELGATQQFAAAVASAGNPNRAVVWAVSGVVGGNATVGTIASSGLYTAPQNLPSPPTLTLSAASIADPAKTDTATANVTSSFTLALAGPTALNTGAAGTFNATLAPVAGSNPNLALQWRVNGVLNGSAANGQICAAGIVTCIAPVSSAATVEYRAPLVAPAGGIATISVTSAADAAKSALAVVTINTVVAVTISPAIGVAVALDGSQQFAATVSGTTDQRIVWDVNGVTGGNQLTTGAISNSPTLLGPATFFAPSQLPGGTNTVTIRATSQFDTSKSASVIVQLFSNVVVAVSTSSGSSVSLRAIGRKETLCVGIGNTANTTLVWTVNNVVNGNSTLGTIAPGNNLGCPPLGPPGSQVFSFDYTAPAAVPSPPIAPTVVATATSVADPSRSGSVTITILAAPTVSVSPPSLSLPTDGTAQFSAFVAGTPVLGVAWQVNGVANGDATVGTICMPASNPCLAPAPATIAAIEYRAPATIPANPTVTIAALGADGGSGSSPVTIVAPPTMTQPAITGLRPASLTAGVASPFLLKVTGTNFVAGSGNGASVILFGAPPLAKTTSCIAPPSAPQECTATVDFTEVAAPASIAVQVQNPDLSLSNSVALVAVPATSNEDVILLSSNTPVVTGKDIVVVEPLGAGSGTQTLNISLLGLLVNNACSAQPSPIVIARPASGSITVTLCIGGTGVLPTQQFSISGSGDVTVGAPQPLSLAFVQVQLPLTVSSTTQKGARTLFVENANKEKSAATGAVEIR